MMRRAGGPPGLYGALQRDLALAGRPDEAANLWEWMMLSGGWRRLLRAMVLAVALTVVVSGWEVVSAPAVSVALAGNNDDKDKKDNSNKGDDGDEDHVARGMVLGIDTLKDPPELILAGADGEMVVRVLKTDEIALNGVRLCDHLKVEGEKIHEYLFEATQIDVETKHRC
jgi:hypothetical protein